MRIFLGRWTDISTGVFVDMLKIGNIYEVLHMKAYQLDDRKDTLATQLARRTLDIIYLAGINSSIQDTLVPLCIVVTADTGPYAQTGCQNEEADVVCF
jgi:hypothetical protein